MKKLHLMTQDDQPIGSERKCCERCGVAYWNWGKPGFYVGSKEQYTKEAAKEFDLILCCDDTLEVE